LANFVQMKSLSSLAALLLVAACSSGQPPPSAQLFGYVPSRAAHPDHRKSWISPIAKSIKYLLYASDGDTDDVNVYNYKTLTQIGTLTGFDGPTGQCVDAKGDVYIANSGNGEVIEYARGASIALKTYRPAMNGEAIGCAVDREGDLAASDYLTFSTTFAALCVWKAGSGSSTCYQNAEYCSFMFPPAYDDKGNLILVGFSYQYSGPEVCGLLANSASLIHLTFSNTIYSPGGTVWDGKHIALGDTDYNGQPVTAMYQVTLKGSTLTKVGTTVLTDTACDNKNIFYQPFVVAKRNTPVNRRRGKTVIGGNSYCDGSSAGLELWRYPAGGAPYEQHGLGFVPAGQSVSVAP
jgi:hypothetical protein